MAAGHSIPLEVALHDLEGFRCLWGYPRKPLNCNPLE
jgi:hypothetical protein